MFRFLAPIIGAAQDWILVDADAALLDEAFGRIAAWARRHGFAATSTGDELLVSTPQWAVAHRGADGQIWRTPMPGSELPHGWTCDAVVCSALLDLVSRVLARALVRSSCASRSSPASPSMGATHGCRAIRWTRASCAAFRRDQRATRVLASPWPGSIRVFVRSLRGLCDGIGALRLAYPAHRSSHAARIDRRPADAPQRPTGAGRRDNRVAGNAAAPGIARQACHNHRPSRHTGSPTGRITPCC